MDSEFQFSINADAFLGVTEDEGIVARAGGSGWFDVEVWREGKLHRKISFPNGITTGGINHDLAVEFTGATQVPTWYCFPISNVSFTALNVADTMNSHAGWLESINYSEANRVQWTAGTPAGGSITNSVQMIMTINTDGTSLVGLGICSINTKNTTTGILWATGLFGAVQNMNSGDVLKISYTVTITPVS